MHISRFSSILNIVIAVNGNGPAREREQSQGQYWAGRTPPLNNPRTPNITAANFVVITNGERCALNGTAVAAVC